MAGFESKMMVGRGPDGLPKVMEVDADGYLAGVSTILANTTDLDHLLATDHREKIYPWDSIGVTVTGGALSTWGTCMTLIPIDGIRDDYGHVVPSVGTLMKYGFVGLSLISLANPTRTLSLRMYRITKTTRVTLSADSGAAHAPTTHVRIADTSGFRAGDVVWLVDDNTANGELGTISSIVTNSHLVLTAALTQNFTVAQNAYVYLARRGGVTNNDYRCMWCKYQAAGVNNMRRIYFHVPPLYSAGDGIVIEAYDLANVAAPGQVAVTAYYDDCPC